MKVIAAVALLMVIGFGPVLAQNSEQFHNCMEKAVAQNQINACAGAEAKRADAQLNEIYQKLLSAASSQPNAVTKITAAEKAWITYRDAYLDAMYPAADKLAEYGSMWPTEVDLLRAELTYRQIEALKRLLEHYNPPQR